MSELPLNQPKKIERFRFSGGAFEYSRSFFPLLIVAVGQSLLKLNILRGRIQTFLIYQAVGMQILSNHAAEC